MFQYFSERVALFQKASSLNEDKKLFPSKVGSAPRDGIVFGETDDDVDEVNDEQPEGPLDSEEPGCAPRFDDPHDDIEAQIATGDPKPDEEATTSDVVNIFLRKPAVTNEEPNAWQKHVVEGQVSSMQHAGPSLEKLSEDEPLSQCAS